MYYGAHSPEKHKPLKCFFLCFALSVYARTNTTKHIAENAFECVCVFFFTQEAEPKSISFLLVYMQTFLAHAFALEK